jgi:hypothetical protein
MAPTDHDDLDVVVGRALKELDAPRAPRTLLPRVMAAAAAREERQGVRPWMQWPRSQQIATLAALVLFTAGVAWLVPNMELVMRASATWLASRQPALSGGLEGAASFLSVGQTLWQALVGPVLWYVVVWMVVMATACAAFGAALDLALGGASE